MSSGYSYIGENGEFLTNLGFTYNGKHSFEYGLYIRTRNIPLLPQKKVSEETVINKHGSYKFEDGYSDKIIDVECILINGTLQERRLKAREIAVWLSQKGNLIFDHEPDKYYVVEYVNEINPEFLERHNVFTITFVCEPFAYSIYSNEDAYMLPDFKIDGEMALYLNTTFNDIYEPTTVKVSNLGTCDALPIIEIDGMALSIIIGTDTESFSIEPMMEKTYVDCKNMIVYTVDQYGKKQNKLSDFVGNFIKLKPGINDISIEGTYLGVNISFKFKNAYL